LMLELMISRKRVKIPMAKPPIAVFKGYLFAGTMPIR